jgi:hypothetical protein
MTSAQRDATGSSRWTTIAWVLGPTITILILAFLLFRTGSDDVLPASSAVASVLATPTPFPTLDQHPISAASLALTAVLFDKDAVITDFVLAGSRVIATGSNGDAPAAWYSDDSGASWIAAAVRTSQPPEPRDIVEMSVVASHGAMLLAIGEWHRPGDGRPVAHSTWVSSDAGATWVEQPRVTSNDRGAGLSGQLLTATDLGFVTVQSGAFPIIRTSADGSTWTDVEDGNNMAHADIREIVGRDNVLLAVGRDRASTQSGLATPDAWTYTEGDGWTVLVNRFDRAAIGALVADATGMYAAGIVLGDPETTAGSIAALWHSDDGTRWQSRTLSAAPDRVPGPMAHGPAGTLVMGDSADPGDKGGPPAYAWFIPSHASADEPPQEYSSDRSGRAAVALTDRFLVFGVCPPQSKACTQPAVLTFVASTDPYSPAASDD